jgi:uncharacterized protein YdhG (YjbR/CyaY superfamily)
MINAKNVDDYIVTQPEDVTEMLHQIREVILTTAPKAEEIVSYGVPCYKLNGPLVGFGAQKKGISFYTMNTKMPEAFKNELIGYKYASSTIHINKGQKMPTAILKKIIRERIKENAAKAAAKNK